MRGAGGKAKRGWEGGCPASVWAEFRGMRWSVELGILRWKEVGFCWISGGFRRNAGLVSLREEGMKLQEFLGEIGESIRRGLEDASGSGLLSVQEAEDLVLWVGFRGKTVLSLAGNCFRESSLLSGINPPSFLWFFGP